MSVKRDNISSLGILICTSVIALGINSGEIFGDLINYGNFDNPRDNGLIFRKFDYANIRVASLIRVIMSTMPDTIT